MENEVVLVPLSRSEIAALLKLLESYGRHGSWHKLTKRQFEQAETKLTETIVHLD